MVRILVTDGMEKSAISDLKAKGYEVVEKFYEPDELGDALKDFDAVVVRSATKVRQPIIDKALGGKLKLVIRGGVGVDNIDVAYAEEKGIKVRNTPKASSISVAELAFGQMLAVARFINISNVEMRQNIWNKKKYKGNELYGKTLGVIGFGRIAREVAKRAEVFGMKIIYFDIMGANKDFPQYTFADMDTLLAKADFITLHIPGSKDKKPVLSTNEFAKMKDGVFIVNCARGGVVDEAALLAGLESGKVKGAALDVFTEEPTKNEKLINNPRVSVTPHIGASTVEAQVRIGEEIVQIITEFFK